MKKIIRYSGLIVLLVFTGCAKSSDSTSFDMVEEEVPVLTQPKAVETVERKLIKEGRIEFKTDSIKATRKIIFRAVNKYKGYVSSDREFNSPGHKSNTIVIRIPADNFDLLLKDATQGVEQLESKDINVKDVTEEFLDVRARLKTKKELENRYLDLLKQANNVTEVLEIEKQTGQLRSEIESIEGRLKYLQNQVSFATLTITFFESIPNREKFGNKFKNGFRNGWDNFIWFFVVLVNIWPFIILTLGLIIGIWVYRKRKK